MGEAAPGAVRGATETEPYDEQQSDRDGEGDLENARAEGADAGVHSRESVEGLEEYENVNKDAQRTSYTKRIMEILANIQKQKKEIERVLADMQQLQKEINQLEGKVGRIFSLADEKIFKAAKKDESLRNLYKKIVALHSTFGNTIRTIEQIGPIERYTKELENQIEDEKAKEVGSNLKSMPDYQLLVQEMKKCKRK